ncbi:uncharacterized protein LOC110850050 [Folsomia candida]|uniref:uncharacterized protein LOC110850050 n=1 Tax=Folsomia candida TaxID=158441 RepID=UPI000B8F629E|nr:uncharacterized protein LOC110850050 [Folsomia candida]
MFRTESETRQSFSSSTTGNFVSKTSTVWSENGDFTSFPAKPVVNNVTINNHGDGNTTLANSGDATVTVNKCDGENTKINVPKDDLKVCPIDDGIRISSITKANKKIHIPCLYVWIVLAVFAILVGILLTLWLSDVIIINTPIPTPAPLGLTQSTDSEPSSTSVFRHPTSPPTKHFPPIPGQHVEMNHLEDMALITDKTTKVVIRSTNSTEADPDVFQVYKQPHGVIMVQVGHNFTNASDFTNLRRVLQWLSPAVHKLAIDGKISQGCQNDSTVDKDNLPFPSMTMLEIRNFDQCFISNWLKDFWIPAIKRVRIHVVDDNPHYREPAINIIRSSKIDAEIDFDQD